MREDFWLDGAAYEAERFPVEIGRDEAERCAWCYTCTHCGQCLWDPTNCTGLDAADVARLWEQGCDVLEATTVLCPTCALEQGHGVRAGWRIFA